MSSIEKIVIVTQKTFLDELIEKHNTKEQAKFYIEHSGGSFEDYHDQHQTYYASLRSVKKQVPLKLRYQIVEKAYLPSFLFGPQDLIIVLGRDGLVVNTAKYLNEQPILGINPDPSRIDGKLLQFEVDQVEEIIDLILEDNAEVKRISLVEAELNNGQKIVGVNDLFIGHKSHKSARYQIKIKGETEVHSSSGIIISTGLGSTGWMKSITETSLRLARLLGFDVGNFNHPRNFPWDANYLRYAVREAWASNNTSNRLVYGTIYKNEVLTVESLMPEGGVIFSDGMIEDKIHFNSGKIVEIKLSEKKIRYYKNSERS